MKTAVATGDYPYYCANCGAWVDWPKWYPFCSMGCIRGWKEKTIREFLWQLLFIKIAYVRLLIDAGLNGEEE